MKELVQKELDLTFTHYPELIVCRDDMIKAFELMVACYRSMGIVLTCGNGGSAADAEHIVGELMKGFKMKRPITEHYSELLEENWPGGEGKYFIDHLQDTIPAISLVSQSAISTAFINDVAADMVFAQQVFGYRDLGDVLIALSTSGNSKNVVNACKVAKAVYMKTIGMTGEDGGMLREICDVTIRVPARETYRVQEYHLPIYHALCSMIETELFAYEYEGRD